MRQKGFAMNLLVIEPGGAARVDAVFPNWELGIDTDRLDVASDKWCVLGQLFGSFKKGLKALGLTLEEAIALGFHVPTDVTKAEAKSLYEMLDTIWLGAIERRMPAYV
jgi:hypothetical protein